MLLESSYPIILEEGMRMAKPELKTSLCELLGIEYPILLAGMGSRGKATPVQLVAGGSAVRRALFRGRRQKAWKCWYWRGPYLMPNAKRRQALMSSLHKAMRPAG